MKVTYQREGRCLWHEDCKKSHQGIIKEIERDERTSKIECLNCEKRGVIPIGFSGGEIVEVE